MKKDNAELKKVNYPHDRGYKRSLSHPKEFLHFLQKYVGADWMMELEESQLSLCDKEYINKDYEGREADLVYKVEKNTGEELYVFILQELQSAVDYTMIFRVLVYVMNQLLRYFLDTDKEKRERADFRLPAMVPIVFYNGKDDWTAIRELREYQKGGEIFGKYVLNLEYYLVNLSAIEAEDILSTNTVIDNIMYCDKFRNKEELLDAIKTTYDRIELLGNQEKEEFNNWVRYILLSICGNREQVMEAIMSWSGNGVENMTFTYNIIKAVQDEKEEARAEGRAEGRAAALLEILEELGMVSDETRQKIMSQRDAEILKLWIKVAAHAETIEEFEKELQYTE